MAERKITMANTNTYNVKPGDIFKGTWGHTHLNVEFFQVVSVSNVYVRIREVAPEIIKHDRINSETEYRTYDINSKELPPVPYSVWIKDSKYGDRKKLYYDRNVPYIIVGKVPAQLMPTGKHTTIVSCD